LGGCASTFVEPRDGPLAHMRFISLTSGPANAFARTFESDSCSGETRIAALSGIAMVHGRKRIGLPLSDGLQEKSFTETAIRANKPFVFDLGWWAGGAYTLSTASFANYSSCHVTTTFEPREGEIYEATFSLRANGCDVQVNRLQKESTGYRRVAELSARRSGTQCKL